MMLNDVVALELVETNKNNTEIKQSTTNNHFETVVKMNKFTHIIS